VLTVPRIKCRCQAIGNTYSEVAAALDFTIVAFEIMADHVHLFVSVSPKWAPHQIVRRIKSYRSNVLRDEYPMLGTLAASVDALILACDGWQCPFGNHPAVTSRTRPKTAIHPMAKAMGFLAGKPTSFFCT
jgi:hypothetical protein